MTTGIGQSRPNGHTLLCEKPVISALSSVLHNRKLILFLGKRSGTGRNEWIKSRNKSESNRAIHRNARIIIHVISKYVLSAVASYLHIGQQHSNISNWSYHHSFCGHMPYSQTLY